MSRIEEVEPGAKRGAGATATPQVSSKVSGAQLEVQGRRDLARQLRVAQASVSDQFITRWSSRAFSEQALPEGALEALFEAARWAPSASNAQPALFSYAWRSACPATLVACRQACSNVRLRTLATRYRSRSSAVAIARVTRSARPRPLQ